jgi:integrase
MITKSVHLSGENMALYKRKDSDLWQMCLFVNGKKVRRSTKTSNKKIANRIYDKAKVEALEGKFFKNERSKMPFDELVHEFLEKHSKVEKESYKNDISTGKRVTAYFKQTPIGRITPYDLKSWRQWRKQHITRRGTPISKSALNRELTFMKTMFNLAVEWEWLPENPARLLKKLKGEKARMRFLNREEIPRLIDCATPNLQPVIIAAVSTGMRRGEIFNLKWKDVDFEHGFIQVEKTKNKERRDIPIDAFLLETLESLSESRKKGNYVFLQKKGTRITHTFVRDTFKEAKEKAGIEDFRFHDLRHTAASLFASGGCDIMSLKNLLGHKSLAMTQRYSHLMPDAHNRTRRIIHDFWMSSKGNTKKTTPENE